MSGDASVSAVMLRDRQFSLRALFGVTAALGIALAVLTQWQLFAGMAIFFTLFWPVLVIVDGIYVGSKVCVQLGFIFLVAWLGFVFLMTPMCACGGRDYTRGTQCQNNLKAIAVALMNYEVVYKTPPPAYIADESGRPIHSWRVLILPFLEEEALYRKYRFDEPWDGPNNRLLHGQVVRVYECPAVSRNTTETSYMAVVGKETAWPGAEAASPARITDGSSATLQVVEVGRSRVHWMEPRDLGFSGMPFKVNAKVPGGIRSQHQGRSHAMRCDGSVTALPNDISPAEVRALLTCAGNEDLSQFREARP